MKQIFTILILTFASFISFGQDAKSQSILDKLSKKMKDQNSFYVEFSANIKNSSTGTAETETGKGWVKEKKYYASFGENTIISNGLKSWTIVKEEKSVYESDASDEDDESFNPRKLLTIWEDGFKNKYSSESNFNGEAVHVINLYPKNPSSVDYHTVTLYISKVKNELMKAVMKTKEGTVMTYTVTKFIFKSDISDSKFVFNTAKYPGYTVIKD